MRLLREIDDPDKRDEPDDHGDQALHKEHVAPARDAASSIQLVQPKVDNVSRGEHDDLPALEEGEPGLLLAPGIPRGDQVRQARVDAAHSHAEQDSEGDHGLPVADEGCAHGDEAKGERAGREPQPRAEPAHGERRRQLEDDAGDGEDEDADAVAVAEEAQVGHHGRHRRRADDARVQQIQTAEQAGNGAESQVDLEPKTPFQRLSLLRVSPVRVGDGADIIRHGDLLGLALSLLTLLRLRH